MIKGWVAIWDRREAPTTLALIRIGVGLVLFLDFAQVGWLDLVEPMWAPLGEGGIGNVMERQYTPRLYRWFPPTAATAQGAWAVGLLGSLMIMVGAATPLACLLVAFVSTQLGQVLSPTDRGIDMLLRNAMVILAMSGAARTWSVDARFRSGRWGGDGASVMAWPRLLLVVQLLVVYFTAGVQKVGLSWTPMGGYSALYMVLQDPAFAVASASTIDRFYPLTQLATATSWLWEWSTPLAALAWWYRATRTRSGWLRGWMNSCHFFTRWVALGVVFHVGIALFLNLGMFPYGMLVLYPAFLHPDEWARRLNVRRHT